MSDCALYSGEDGKIVALTDRSEKDKSTFFGFLITTKTVI